MGGVASLESGEIAGIAVTFSAIALVLLVLLLVFLVRQRQCSSMVLLFSASSSNGRHASKANANTNGHLVVQPNTAEKATTNGHAIHQNLKVIKTPFWTKKTLFMLCSIELRHGLWVMNWNHKWPSCCSCLGLEKWLYLPGDWKVLVLSKSVGGGFCLEARRRLLLVRF